MNKSTQDSLDFLPDTYAIVITSPDLHNLRINPESVSWRIEGENWNDSLKFSYNTVYNILVL